MKQQAQLVHLVLTDYDFTTRFTDYQIAMLLAGCSPSKRDAVLVTKPKKFCSVYFFK